MYLKKVELLGFKSFADKTEIVIEPGITCIVGPNGSGKSNFADALRWVLGEQKLKQLRGSKLEEIIFSGSQSKKPLSLAQVTLTLDNTKKSLPLDYSEVAITRRTFRDGESEFLLNKNACRLKDIQDLFLGTGLGKDVYSFVGQGQIDLILLSKPEDRRELIEEAAGISKFKHQKKEILHKIESTHQNLFRVKDILAEIISQLEPLQIESEKAKEYLQLKEQLTNKEISFRLWQLKSLQQTRDKIVAEEENLKIQHLQKQTKLKETQQLLSNLEIQQQELNAQFNNLKDELSSKEINHQEMQSNLNYLQQKLISLKQQKDVLENEKNIHLKKINELTTNLNNLTTAADLKITKEELKQEVTKILQEIQEIEQTLTQQKNIQQDITEQILENAREISHLTNEETGLSKEINFLKNNLSKLSQDLEIKNKQKNELLNNLNETTNQINKLLEKLKVLKEKEIKLLAEKDTLTLQQNKIIEELTKEKEELVKLETQKIILKQNYNKTTLGTVDEIFNLKKSKLPEWNDLLGRVGDFVEINCADKAFALILEEFLFDIFNILLVKDKSLITKIFSTLKNKTLKFLPLDFLQNTFSVTETTNINLNNYQSLNKFLKFKNPNLLLERYFSNIYVLDSLSEINFNFPFNIIFISKQGELLSAQGITWLGKEKIQAKYDLESQLKEKENLITEKKQTLKNLEFKLNTLNISLENSLKELNSIQEEILSIDKSLLQLQEKEKIFLQQENLLEQELQLLNNESNFQAKELQTKENQIQQIIAKKNQEEETENNLNTNLNEEKNTIHNLENDLLNKKDLLFQKKVLLVQEEEKYLSWENQLNSLNYNLQEEQKNLQRIKELIINLHQEATEIENKLPLLSDEIEVQKTAISSQQNNLNEIQQKLLNLNNEIHNANQQKEKIYPLLEHLSAQINSLQIDKAKAEVTLQDAKIRLEEEYEINVTTENLTISEEIDFVPQERESEIRKLRKAIIKLGPVNVNSIEEYKRLNERHNYLTEQKNDLEESLSKLQDILKELDEQAKNDFINTFNQINENFKNIFNTLFPGGKGELLLTDTENILECGLDFNLQFTGKGKQNLSLLSGGEKSLTAIALMFSILATKPSPFCILDEIDAALDEANVRRFTALVKDFSQKTQFIIITHNKATMEIASILYGVTTEEKGVSKIVSVKLSEVR